MSEATKPHWYLVQARPRLAALAVEHLERQGYCVFHPRLQVEQLRRGRPVVVEQALFPVYLFIRLQAGVDNFGPVRSTRGVAQLVGFGNVPVPFDANLIESLRSHLAAAPDAPDPGVAALLGLAEPRERIRALMGLVGRKVTTTPS